MKIEHQLKEPYRSHVLESQQEVMKLRAERAEALARVYGLDQSILAIERHIDSLIGLEIKAADLPHPLQSYMMRPDGRLIWEAQSDGGKLE